MDVPVVFMFDALKDSFTLSLAYKLKHVACVELVSKSLYNCSCLEWSIRLDSVDSSCTDDVVAAN